MGLGNSTVESEADDHKAYYPGSHRIRMRITGDRSTGRLLGVQLFGHRESETVKRILELRKGCRLEGLTIRALSAEGRV